MSVTPRVNFLPDCSETELDLWLRARKVGTPARLLPSDTAPYVEGEPLEMGTDGTVDRDDGSSDGLYPVVINYDPAGLMENQAVGKTTCIEGGTFYAFVHPDMFDQYATGDKVPAAGDMLSAGLINEDDDTDRPYRGYYDHAAENSGGTFFVIGQLIRTGVTKNNIDYHYVRFTLPGYQVYVA